MPEKPSVHTICDEYVRDVVRLDPITGTYLGDGPSDEKLTDFSPDAVAERHEVGARALRAVRELEPADEAQGVAKAVFTERMGLAGELHDAGEDLGELNVIDSPIQGIRQVFDLMPTGTDQDWATVATRLAAVPASIGSMRENLRSAASKGHVSAARQVSKVAGQCDTWAKSFFHDFVGTAQVPDSLRGDLDAAADAAAGAYAELGDYLRNSLLADAPQKDAVGEQRYRLFSRQFTGASLDLEEAYEWGWAEFATLEREMKQVADRIEPGATPTEAAALLDADPRYVVTGKDELEAWMQKLSDGALKELRGKHFELPDELMALECKVAPPGGPLGAYYTGPTDDFSRPGRMWWSIGADQTEFPIWRDVTTVYHEGVPGHHLQVATATLQAKRLNAFQRQLSFISGHGEGWALYAERLMRELGYLADDGHLLGMLDAHIFRACRVIVDIGMHLEMKIPGNADFHPGQRWTPDLALEFMMERTLTPADYLRDEIDRYLGWPGQAPSYKLGERLWLQAREQARVRAGASFDIKEFHSRALEMGPMGLDTLAEQLADL
jgi:uncharacterized protein (DUF885 family)